MIKKKKRVAIKELKRQALEQAATQMLKQLDRYERLKKAFKKK